MYKRLRTRLFILRVCVCVCVSGASISGTVSQGVWRRGGACWRQSTGKTGVCTVVYACVCARATPCLSLSYPHRHVCLPRMYAHLISPTHLSVAHICVSVCVCACAYVCVHSELLSTLQPNIQAAHTYHPQPTNTVLWLTRTPTHDTHDDVTTHADTHADSALSAARAGRLLRVWWGWAAAAPAGVGGAAASAGAEVDSTADLLSVTLRVSSSDVLRVCEGREEQPVLYVAHPLEVVWSDTDTHTKQVGVCCIQTLP